MGGCCCKCMKLRGGQNQEGTPILPLHSPTDMYEEVDNPPLVPLSPRPAHHLSSVPDSPSHDVSSTTTFGSGLQGRYIDNMGTEGIPQCASRPPVHTGSLLHSTSQATKGDEARDSQQHNKSDVEQSDNATQMNTAEACHREDHDDQETWQHMRNEQLSATGPIQCTYASPCTSSSEVASGFLKPIEETATTHGLKQALIIGLFYAKVTYIRHTEQFKEQLALEQSTRGQREKEELRQDNEELRETIVELQKQIAENERTSLRNDRQVQRTEQMLKCAEQQIHDLQAAYCQNFGDRDLTEEEADALLEQRSHWLFTPDVVSLCYCSEKRGRKTTGRKVLRVGVIKIIPWEQAAESDTGIQPCIEFKATTGETVKVPVCQATEGPIVPLSAPYEGGSLLKSEAVGVEGCAAAIVMFKGKCCLLSNAHVLTGFDQENIGQPVQIRTNKHEDWTEVAQVSGQFGVRTYPNPLDNPRDAERAVHDLAWCEISAESGIVKSNCIEEIGNVTGVLRSPVIDEAVNIYGGGSKLAYLGKDVKEDGKFVYQLDNEVMVDGRALLRMDFLYGTATQYAYFRDVFKLNERDLLKRGDSGSAVVGSVDSALVGLVFSAGEKSGVTYFCKVVD